MKRSRGILIGLGLVALGAIGCLVALNSGFQTWAARHYLARHPELGVTLERIVIRPAGVEVSGLNYRRGPIVVSVPHLEADLSWWQLAAGRVAIERLVAHGWTGHFDASQSVARHAVPRGQQAVVATRPPRVALAGFVPNFLAAATNRPESAALPAGTNLTRLATWLELPVAVKLGAVDLEGTTSWHHAGPGADGQARIRVTGGEMGPDRAALFHVLVTAVGDETTAGGAMIRSLEIDSRLTLQLSGEKSITRIEAISALVGRRTGQEALERYSLNLSLVMLDGRPTVGIELHDERKQLFGTEIAPSAKGDTLSGKWNVAMSDQTLSSLMLGRPLPRFLLQGAGEVTAQFDLSDVSIAGQLDFDLDELQTVRTELGAIGPLRGGFSFAVQQIGADLRCTSFDLQVRGAAPVAQIRLLQGVEVANAGEEFRVADPSAPVMAVDLLGVPAVWLQPWIDPWVVDARAIHGHLVGLVTPHGLRLVTSDGLFVDGFVFSGKGRTLIDEVDVAINAGGEITQEGWQFELDRLDVSDATGLLASASLRGGRLMRENEVMKMVGHVETDLAALRRLPVLANVAEFAGGRVEANFGVGLEDRLSVASTITMSGLRTIDGEPLPDLQADSRVDLLADGGIEAHVPMRFSRGGRVSDLTLNVSAQRDANRSTWTAEGSLSGPRAYVEDLQLLGLPFAGAGGASEAAGSDSPSLPSPAEHAVWAGFSGTFKTAIGSLTLPNGIVLENVRGDLSLADEQITLSGLHADMGGGAIDLEGALGFDAANATPYSAAGHFKAQGLDMGPLLQALQTDRPPALEGKLNVSADLKSEVVSLDQLPTQAAVSARMTSAGGVLRALGVKVDQAVEVGKTASLLTGLIAAVSGNSKALNVTQRLQTVTSLAERLSAVTFDQFNVELSRVPQGDLELRDLSLISPGLRLLGSGRVSYAAGVPLWQQPLAVTLKLAARDEIAGYLQKLNLVSEQADSLGYRPMVQDLELDGSLAQVGTAEIQRVLMKAAGLR